MYAIYGNIYHQYTPFMLVYIPAPWIHMDPMGKSDGHWQFVTTSRSFLDGISSKLLAAKLQGRVWF